MDEKKRENEKDELSSQIVHEAEITRQQARYHIPAKMEIDGRIYTLKDWSLTGCSVKNLPDEYLGKFLSVKIIFKFDQFETIIDNLTIECLHKSNDSVGCRFTELTPQQFAILNQIINAYISGDIVTQDDIITAVTKIQMYPKKPKIDKIEVKKAKRILFLIFVTIFILFSFLFFIIYKKLFVVESVNGYVDSNITVIRAPYPSYIKFECNITKGIKIKKDKLIAVAHLINGGISTVISPVNGTVIRTNTKNNEFRNIAEPIVTLLDDNSSLFVKSTFFAKDLIKIRSGYIVKFILNGELFYGKIYKITYPEKIDTIKSKPAENVYANPYNYIMVYIKPFGLKNKNTIGESVIVKLDTFVNKLGIINEKNYNSFIFNIF